MSVKTQGTELFFIDPANGQVVEVGCVTNLTGLTAERDQIEVTCLDSTAREYTAGMAAPGQAQFTLNFDPSDASHVRLHQLYVEGLTIDWALGWADGTTAPTGDSSGFTLPTDRTFLIWDGFLTSVPFDFALNTVVTSNCAIQVSDFPTLVPKTT